MNEKKNIERLFQEKFKDFEARPSSQVWKNIAAELEKKENKKRILPFWFNMKAAGIAAAFILGTFMASNYTNTFRFNPSKNASETVVSTEKRQKQNLNNPIVENSKNENSTTNKSTESSIISNKNNLVETHTKKEYPSDEMKKEISKNPNTFSEENQDKNILTNKYNSIVNNSNNQNLVINKSKNISRNNNQEIKNVSINNKQIIASQNNGNKVSKNKLNFDTKKSSTATLVSSESTTNKATSYKSFYSIKKRKSNQKNDSNFFDNASETRIVEYYESKNLKSKTSKKSELNKNKIPLKNEPSENLVQNKNSKNPDFLDVNANYSIANTTIKSTIIPDAIAKDTVIVAIKNPLEKILKEKETKEKEEKKIAENTQRWKVKPNVAPLFMSATKGSPIDEQFADNTKSYENSLSVGLGVDYAVSKKLSIRTGINKFDYSYNTNDIVYYADFAAKNANSVNNLKTINVASDAKNMIIEDKNVSKSQEIALQTKEEGLLNQKTGYLEIPVEVSYKLLDNKFGIQVITGFSSLLLNKNEVSVTSSGLTTVVGEANNLNKVH